MFLIVILGYVILALFELLPLYQQKQWREFWVLMCLTLVSFSFALLISLGIEIPSPAEPLEKLFTTME
ncbi:MAG TPA: hypothetical protein VHS59_08870 [Bacillota bacterium]|nr:hypothetical protein [Bacillota bacterium]